MKKINSDRLIKIAETMERQAEDKFRPRETHTAKKLAQARHAELEGAHLKRAATLIRSLVKAIGENRVPDCIYAACPLTKDFFMSAARLETKRVSNGYHDYLVETDNYRHNENVYQSLRSLESQSPENEAKMQARMQEVKLRRAIDSVRNQDIPGFFPTPRSVINKMLSIVDQHIVPGARVLEPSAGMGDIVEAITTTCKGVQVDAIEISPTLCEILRMKQIPVINDDFMLWSLDNKYDCIVMNPPYENRQAIKHSTKAYQHLKPGGGLVCLMPPIHAEKVVDSLMQEGCEAWAVEPVDDGAFNSKESFRRTGVSVAIVYAVKHEDSPVIVDLGTRQQSLLF
jgi:16S rRNA G966 N2-methylase RsmD